MNTHGLLPFSAYTSNEFFKKEKEYLFAQSWHFIWVISDISPWKPIKRKILNNNIIIIQKADLSLKAFYNVCRHRGTGLLEEKKWCIVCPYHNWSYDNNGKLIGIPNQDTFRNLNKASLHLHPVQIDTYKGMIFINFSDTPIPITEAFGVMDEYLEGYDSKKFDEYTNYRQTLHVKANWKIVVENFIDIYHLSYLHQNTLWEFDHLKMKQITQKGCWWSYDPYKKKVAEKYGLKYESKEAWEYVSTLFPNTWIHENYNGNFSLFHMIPISVNETIIELRSFGPKGLLTKIFNGISPKYKSNGSSDPLQSGNFMQEDIYAMESQQEAFSSDKFWVWSMSDLEEPIFEFHKEILKYIK